MARPDFWDDQEKAGSVIKSVNVLKSWVVPLVELSRRSKDLIEMYPEFRDSQDEEMLGELESEMAKLEEMLADLETKRMLSGELDASNCFVSINAGAGGTESCDWVAMLSRMYLKWFQKKGWKVETIDQLDGEVAGIKNVTYKVTGLFAYGYCKAESGVHRLVRISPFDSNAKRHTSFASVEVIAEVENEIEVEVKPDDIRVDTYRASGAGGQHVNTTESAVRITHKPTGLVVTCQKERSQIQNRETCMKMLKSRIHQKELEERKKAASLASGEKKDIAWGSQIRNYVFHPYTLVKDNRTKVEQTDIAKVMDGEIDPFVLAYLKEFGGS